MSSTKAVAPYYLPPPDGSPAYKNINDRNDKNYIRHEVLVDIEDVRGREDLFSLDTCGFQYFKHTSKHTAFCNDAEIKAEYYPETENLLKRLTGASKIVIFDYTVRRHTPGETEESPLKRQPVSNVHIDQTPASAVARVYRHLPEDEATKLLQDRFQVMNLWRPIAHPAYDWPLGFIDSSTVDYDNDLFKMKLKFPGGPGETYAVKHSPRHKWYYLRGMTPEEVVMFKCFDSIKDENICSFNAHSGFEDPSTPEDAPLRESIEIRALVFYSD